MAFKGWFDGELRPDAWFDAELQPAGWFDTEIIGTESGGGGITGTTESSQAQTSSASGSFTLSAVSGAIATYQAQTLSAVGLFATGSISGVITTSQAQSISGAGVANPQAVSGAATTRQAQTQALSGAANPQAVSGTGSTTQGQSVSATGAVAVGGVIGFSSPEQAQTAIGTGEFIEAVATSSFNGGFVMRPRKVYVSRGRHYLIFNTHEEADAYLVAEEAIEAAKKSSRGAAKRKIKALKVVKPEIVAEPKLDELSLLLAKFNVNYDLLELQKNNDIEALYHIQSMLYEMQQDEEDIELLLMAAYS
jgi:hypothetical protein